MKTYKKDGKVFTTESFEETRRLGENFAKNLKGGEIIALYGELGSGKTTFVQGLARGLGIKRRIISPTFIIVRSYKAKPSFFYHVDLYRIESAKDIESLGLAETIDDKTSVVAIEWAEKMKGLLPKKRWDVEFEDLKDSRRKIVVNQRP